MLHGFLLQSESGRTWVRRESLSADGRQALAAMPGFGIMSRSLREDVEALLPNWESWYPSLFDAAEDLGLIRARVCSPSSLLLSNRHESVRSAALDAFQEKWGGKE
jgi:hypothetical protein